MVCISEVVGDGIIMVIILVYVIVVEGVKYVEVGYDLM